MDFHIKRNATLPVLKVGVVADGRSDYNNFMKMIEESAIFFSMINVETGIPKIMTRPAGFVEKTQINPDADPEYYIYYQFTPRDTNKVGRYEAQFLLRNSDGTLILPIREQLFINIQESFIADDLPYESCYVIDFPCCVSDPSVTPTPTPEPTTCICETPTPTPSVTPTPTPIVECTCVNITLIGECLNYDITYKDCLGDIWTIDPRMLISPTLCMDLSFPPEYDHDCVILDPVGTCLDDVCVTPIVECTCVGIELVDGCIDIDITYLDCLGATTTTNISEPINICMDLSVDPIYDHDCLTLNLIGDCLDNVCVSPIVVCTCVNISLLECPEGEITYIDCLGNEISSIIDLFSPNNICMNLSVDPIYDPGCLSLEIVGDCLDNVCVPPVECTCVGVGLNGRCVDTDITYLDCLGATTTTNISEPINICMDLSVDPIYDHDCLTLNLIGDCLDNVCIPPECTCVRVTSLGTCMSPEITYKDCLGDTRTTTVDTLDPLYICMDLSVYPIFNDICLTVEFVGECSDNLCSVVLIDLVHPLGRIYTPDSRDNNYLIENKLKLTTPIITSKYWNDNVWWGNQGQTPQCVGYSWSHWIEDGPITPVATIRPTVSPITIYREAQKLDVWVGENYDGTSVRGGAIYLKNINKVSSYLWTFNLTTLINTVLTIGPVVVGTNWYSGMFYPDRNGLIRVTGRIAGGHAYVINGVDTVRRLFRIKNSWGRTWGLQGRAFISFSDMARLIREHGEVCLAIENVL